MRAKGYDAATKTPNLLTRLNRKPLAVWFDLKEEQQSHCETALDSTLYPAHLQVKLAVMYDLIEANLAAAAQLTVKSQFMTTPLQNPTSHLGTQCG